MRISILIDQNNRIVPNTVGALPRPEDLTDEERAQLVEERKLFRTIRLPRRLVKYYKARSPWGFDWSLASWDLGEGALNKILDKASSFLEGQRNFRRTPKGPWKAGDPCYVNGEGSNRLFFLEAVERSSVIVNGCREGMSKLTHPTFSSLFGHLENALAGFHDGASQIVRLRHLISDKKPAVSPDRIGQAAAKLAGMDPGLAEAILEMIEKQG